MTDPNDFPMSEPEGAEDQRVAVRESTFLGAKVAHDGKIIDGRIRNISATGAYLEADADLHGGDRICMTFRGFEEIGATVTRATARGVGVRFDAPIDSARCRQSPLIAGQFAHFEPVRYVAPVLVRGKRSRPKLFQSQPLDRER